MCRLEAAKMNITKVAGVLLAVLLVVGGTAAALPGNAPTDAQAENAQTENPEAADSSMNETADDEADRRGPPAGVGPSGDAGPPTDLPGPVPDFVSEIHSVINDHIAGALDVDLGSAIADLTPGGETDSNDEADSDVPTPTPDGNATTTAPPA